MPPLAEQKGHSCCHAVFSGQLDVEDHAKMQPDVMFALPVS